MALLTEQKYVIGNIPDFKDKALQWASSFKNACYFESNDYPDPYSKFDSLIAAGNSEMLSTSSVNALDQLQAFLDAHKVLLPGFLSYDLKNEIENLQSANPDHLGFPLIHFFVPEHLLLIKGNAVIITSTSPASTIREINDTILTPSDLQFCGEIKSRYTREEYIETVKDLQEHIRRGDIYEVNFCQEFYAENAQIDPLMAFRELNRISPTPFANFVKADTRYIISATPERFLSKKNNKLVSQPIKGTAKRSDNPLEDQQRKNSLRDDAKELAENVMIVDLVRNDLTKCALSGTVRVEELFGIYSFKHVHQMISTIVCDADPALSNTDILKRTFPMGSMTGAPKINAMQLIDKYERTKRGIFSGAVGYFDKNGDFDFNVIIRSLLYNDETGYLSFQVGSAITFDADAAKEYEECAIKTAAIRQVLSHTTR